LTGLGLSDFIDFNEFNEFSDFTFEQLRNSKKDLSSLFSFLSKVLFSTWVFFSFADSWIL